MIYRIAVILSILLLISTGTSYGARLHHEKVYQDAWCEANGGIRHPDRKDWEWPLEDGSRADCVTKKYAIEFDFADKWAESIGQSQLYSAILKRRAGIVLIMERGARDDVYLGRLNKALKKINSKRWRNRTVIWTMTPEDLDELLLKKSE